MDPCSSNPNGKKSSARRTTERKEKQKQLQLEINAQQRWQQTHGGITSQSYKYKSGASSAISGQIENDGEDTGCRMSECCSPTSDILGKSSTFRGTKVQDRNFGVSLLGARPLGNIEKVIEYRTILNGQSVELRRVTASVEGPVEHLQVVNAPTGAPGINLPALIMRKSQFDQQAQSETGEKRTRRSNGKPLKVGGRRKSTTEHVASAIPSGVSKPWLDYEGPPGQHATVWNGHTKIKEKQSQKHKLRTSDQGFQELDYDGAKQFPDSYRLKHVKEDQSSQSRQIQRLAMNGSQPCLMVATPGASASADIHLHYPQKHLDSTIVSMDPNIETNTAKLIPIGGGISSNIDEFSLNPFDHTFYRTDETANAQTLLHSARASPQKTVSSSASRKQSLPRTGQQINIFHNGATHHHYFPPSVQNISTSDMYQYHESPPRPQSSADVQYQQSLTSRYYSQQPTGFDSYLQVDDANAAQQLRV